MKNLLSTIAFLDKFFSPQNALAVYKILSQIKVKKMDIAQEFNVSIHI